MADLREPLQIRGIVASRPIGSHSIAMVHNGREFAAAAFADRMLAQVGAARSAPPGTVAAPSGRLTVVMPPVAFAPRLVGKPAADGAGALDGHLPRRRAIRADVPDD